MKNIYGTIGYTFLNSNEVPNFILVLSDIHSKLKYCDDFIEISEWIKNNMYNINILLEEVSREDFVLGELWESSDHTRKLKDLFLENKSLIHDIDIRPYLIPFSWELLKNKDLSNLKMNPKIKLKFYLENVNEFLYFKLNKIRKKLPNVYNRNFVKNHKLNIQLNIIKSLFKNYIINNISFMDLDIVDIHVNHQDILVDLNIILDSCMEWFIIAKMYELTFTNNNNIIIHTGLFHSERINNVLHDIYNYKIINQGGINTIDNAENNEDLTGCITLPNSIEEKINSKIKNIN
jgi:hypothetical protein